MKNFILMAILIIVCSVSSYGQNIIIQQNNQQQKEKVIIKEKEVPVYIEKSEGTTQPIMLHGYLYVYPDDLGMFRVCDFPYDVIANINKVRAYGRNTWRLPTRAELEIMEEANGGEDNKSGLLHLYAGVGCRYMIQDDYSRQKKADMNDHYSPDSFQKIRLVSTD